VVGVARRDRQPHAPCGATMIDHHCSSLIATGSDCQRLLATAVGLSHRQSLTFWQDVAPLPATAFPRTSDGIASVQGDQRVRARRGPRIANTGANPASYVTPTHVMHARPAVTRGSGAARVPEALLQARSARSVEDQQSSIPPGTLAFPPFCAVREQQVNR
jgi:hypothetical protein